ncbi:MAG TPA: PAS domain S-box protein [Candidatus Sulfotelmatobacter sp.]|nr:PAS domain S-box protein [Candidatus Sulfotelmatobacter sp.]
MSQTLRILHLEDNPADALLVRDLLEYEGVPAQIRHTRNRAEFLAALPAEKWDLMISDYKLPDCTGLDALKIVRAQLPDLPFILMSGTIGEHAAIESLKAGATDYVLKHNRERLPSAVRRAIAESAERALRQETQEELKRSEKQYRILFQGNPHPMWVFDLETLKFLEVNEAAVQHYGYSRDEFLAMALPDLRADERGGHALPDANVIWRHRRKDGVIVDMEVKWSPLAFHGKLAALTMATDVTARRRSAQHSAVLSKLSHRLSAATTAAEAAMFICEAADELFRWDDFALDLYSAAEDAVVSLLSITTIEGQRVEIPASPQPQHANAIVRRVITRGAEVISAQETGERSGTTMIAPIRKGENVIGVLFVQARRTHSYAEADAATLQTLADQCGGALQRVRAEDDLRQSRQRFHDLFENSPDAIFVEGFDGVVLDVNAAACALHGLSREQLIGKNAVEELVPPSRREAARESLARIVEGKTKWFESESLTAGGRVVPVEARVVRVDFDGRPALLFHVRDVSERYAAESALRSSEALFRSVWENSVDGMRLTDENGTIIAVNSAYCRLVGLSQDQLEAKPFSVVYETGNDWQAMLQNHRQNFRTGYAEQKAERNFKLHDGRQVVFEITDSYVESGGKPRLQLSLFRDVTLHKRLEEQLRQSQKMEAIGQLAGGVAHDFNNILTIILGHATLLGMTPLEAKAQTSATQIKQAAERAAGLTRQLLAFGRKQIVNPRPLDLNRVVGGMTQMLGRLLGEDIALQLNFSNDPAIVDADPTMMEQILLNLSVNSRDAMPKGGRLGIRISQREVDTAYIRKSVEATPGKFVCLSHTDTGSGIPPENMQRIFEPFFTTKELGKGTGLGLATVYGIVKQHKGWVEVESEVGNGTTFHIFLPASTVKAPEIEVATETQFRALGGTETVLVVEDERDLREIITRTLNRHGYRVFQAVDGNNALEIWREYKNEIQLLFTDVIMPGGMNGRELAEKLWAERPNLKVIFSTGYGADALGKNFKLDPDLNYLQKPYLPHALARIVRKQLDTKTN